MKNNLSRNSKIFVLYRKGDIFSSLENVDLVAMVNKNYLSHSGLRKSGLTVSSILKHWRSSPFFTFLSMQSSTLVWSFKKLKVKLRKNFGKKSLLWNQCGLDVWLVSMEWLLSRLRSLPRTSRLMKIVLIVALFIPLRFERFVCVSAVWFIEHCLFTFQDQFRKQTAKGLALTSNRSV